MRTTIVRVILVVLAVGLVVSSCGDDRADTTSTPGLVDGERGVDRSRFEMEGADVEGSTTIPGPGPTLAVPTSISETGEVAVLGQLPPSKGGPDPFNMEIDENTPFTVPKRTTTTTRPTTTVPPPTTTLPPTTTTTTIPELYLPPLATITSVCGLSKTINTVFRGTPDPGTIFDVATRLNQNLDRYLELAPEVMRPDIVIIQTAVRRLTGLYESGGRSLTSPALTAETFLLVTGQPPYADLSNTSVRIAFRESTVCGGIG